MQHFLFINYSRAVARKVVIVFGHKPRVLGSLAAYERAARSYAALSHAAYYFGYFFGVIFSAGNIIKKEKRLCPAADYIVNAHCNAVYAYGIVAVKQHCKLYFCAYTVCARNQNGFFNAFKVKPEATSEAAHIVKAARRFCSCNVAFHKLNRFIARGYINAGGGV